jgi:hypothetical protein
MNKWYEFTFRINWPENQEPWVWIDIFLADTLVRNVLERWGLQISLWRIHRRWFPDEKGHEFSLECYTTEEVASSIDNLFKNSKEHKMLQENKLLKLYNREKEEKVPKIEIEDTAVKENWPSAVKKTWPYYIRGCCEMFLHLIEVVKHDRESGDDIEQIEKFYKEVNERLTVIWQSYGCSAFLHHLNAIFGYGPCHLQMRLWGSF